MIDKLRTWLRGNDTPPDPSVRILMVCTGNICRSPTAEGVLRAKLEQAGLATQVVVDSAGTQGFHTNEAPDQRAIRAAARRGYDIAGIKARPIRPEDFTRFDWLLALDQTHLDWLIKRGSPAAVGRAGLLMTMASRSGPVLDVPDPYFGGPDGFEHVLNLIEDACDGAVARLRAGQPLAAAR